MKWQKSISRDTTPELLQCCQEIVYKLVTNWFYRVVKKITMSCRELKCLDIFLISFFLKLTMRSKQIPFWSTKEQKFWGRENSESNLISTRQSYGVQEGGVLGNYDVGKLTFLLLPIHLSSFYLFKLQRKEWR